MKLQHRIAGKLLNNVYYPVSAVISLDAQDNVLDMCMFDTEFAGAQMHVDRTAQQIWLMTNHPEGWRKLRREDVENLKRLKKLADGLPISVFITGEDIGCIEVTVERVLF